jgi:hypothetical protein
MWVEEGKLCGSFQSERNAFLIAKTFPGHITNLFQALDLVFFSALKKAKETAIGEFDDDSVNAQVIKLFQTDE